MFLFYFCNDYKAYTFAVLQMSRCDTNHLKQIQNWILGGGKEKSSKTKFGFHQNFCLPAVKIKQYKNRATSKIVMKP